MPSAKGRARLFSGERPAKELDPEAEAPLEDEDVASDSEDGEQVVGADTEHYVAVGKSKIRQKQPLALGPAYRGTRVSREQLEQDSEGEFDEENDDDEEDDEEEEFDDPEDVDVGGAEDVDDDNDGEIDSDEAFGSSDEELVQKFTFRGSSVPRVPNSRRKKGDDEDEDEEDDEDEDEEDGEQSESDMDDNEGGDEDDETGEGDQQMAKAEAETRKILAEERQRMLAPISQSAKADADKGFAVRQQRRTFDALLNMRIRMQKALTASNSLHVVAKEGDEGKEGKEGSTVDQAVVEDAVTKAIALLTSIQSIRQSFYVSADSAAAAAAAASSAAEHKRKRGGGEGSCADIFGQMAQMEEAALGKRRKVLDRWATRVQRPSASASSSTAAAASASKRFLTAAGPQALTAMLDEQLTTAEERLVRRTRVPRSCAPVQSARRVAEDAEIYDDADFYQLLLKELVDQRTTDSSAPGNALPTVRWAASAAKEAKTRKVVDRKASKGRKMRFNVHEKLQNFTAPEDRRQWEPEAIDRLFGTLFGQRSGLREEDDVSEDEENGGVDLEEEGLRLFRS